MTSDPMGTWLVPATCVSKELCDWLSLFLLNWNDQETESQIWAGGMILARSEEETSVNTSLAPAQVTQTLRIGG